MNRISNIINVTMMANIRVIAVAMITSVIIATTVVMAGTTKSIDGTKVYFVAPKDGDVIDGSVKVIVGLTEQMGVAPALVAWPNTGHHHIIINTDVTDMSKPIPKNDQHIHLGLGQTEKTITLPAGTHQLYLLFGDHAHIPHDKPIFSDKITITVK